MNPQRTKKAETITKEAEIKRRLLRGESVHSIVVATRSARATVCAVSRELGVVRWTAPVPRDLSAAADAARGPLTRAAYFVAVLTRALDAEARREGP